MKVLLDTHVLIWLMEGQSRLGKRALAVIEKAKGDEEAFVSAITFLEVGMLEQRGRIDIAGSALAWRRSVLNAGIQEIAVDGWIAVEAAGLGVLRDPGDRLIMATALHEDLTLITADQAILDWHGKLARLDAAR